MPETIQENKMGYMPENKLLLSMAIPMMISMLVQALYNVVDSIFVARLSEDALTAVSVAFPLQSIMISVSVGFGVGIKGTTPVTDIEEALIRMLRSTRKHGKRVLITIDEVTNSRDIRVFASAYQIFLREELPVFLLMTGLYNQIDRLRNAEGMTFLERAPRTVLSPLNFVAMVDKYINTLKISEEAAVRLAKATKGYSFAFQVVGYYAWEQRDHLDHALIDAKEYLFEFAYQKIWSELSGKDRELVLAVFQSETGEVSRVREIMNWTSNQFNPYRDRLLKSGVISSPQTGYVELALPWFGEYASSVMNVRE